MNKQMTSSLSSGDNTPVVLVSDSNLEVKEVEFLNDSLLVIKDNSKNKIYTGVGYVCKGIGLSEGQSKNEKKRIQDDVVLSKGGRNLITPTNGGNQEVLAIDIDYLPIWLAKISITPKMKEQQPEVVEKLVEYQLKAKDVLANAFIHKKVLTPQEELRLHYQYLTEVDNRLYEVKQEVSDLKENIPLFNIDCKELQYLVRKKGIEALGGYKSQAYNDKSLRSKVYADIQNQLRREFGVNKYERIKHSQLELAKQIVNTYKIPLALSEQVEALNNQTSFLLSE